MARAAAEIFDQYGEASLTGISQFDFRRLIETTADGVLVVDLTGTVLYASGGGRDLRLSGCRSRPDSPRATGHIG
ncbi:PAS domain-containing protein [Mesorhizobium sp. M0664]|uniref:PAS domain-containing protein n=1 Tax=Mesorhizobium sp. M0664 TaxID=2956982 RepID=UPI003337E53F